MGCCQAGDRNSKGRAGHIVKTERVAKFDARGIATVFAANPDLQVLADLPALLHTHPHELTDALSVEGLEWIEGQDSPVHEIEEELAFRVVTGISKRRLCEIVRSEGEELRVLRDFGEGNPEAASPKAQHRVRFPVRGDGLEKDLLPR